MFLYVPSEKSGQAYKFAKPYRGPYLVGLYENGADLRLVSQPHDQIIRDWLVDQVTRQSELFSLDFADVQKRSMIPPVQPLMQSA